MKQIPPSGERFTPIRETVRSHYSVIQLGDISVTISRLSDFFSPAVPPGASTTTRLSPAEPPCTLLYLYLCVTDDTFSLQIEQGMAEGTYPDFMRYLQSDRFVEDLKKLLVEFSDDFSRRV